LGMNTTRLQRGTILFPRSAEWKN